MKGFIEQRKEPLIMNRFVKHTDSELLIFAEPQNKKPLCSQPPRRQSHRLEITESKEFRSVPSSRSVAVEECTRPERIGLHSQRGEQGVLPRRTRTNWCDGIPLQHQCSGAKGGFWGSKTFPARRSSASPDLKNRFLSCCSYVRVL